MSSSAATATSPDEPRAVATAWIMVLALTLPTALGWTVRHLADPVRPAASGVQVELPSDLPGFVRPMPRAADAAPVGGQARPA